MPSRTKSKEPVTTSVPEEGNVQQNNTSKSVTGFIIFDHDANLDELMGKLKAFRAEHRFKFTIQGQSHMIYFIANTDDLDKLSAITPFKISKLRSESKYLCTINTYENLKKCKESFMRMIWEDDGITFISRTNAQTHNNLLRRMFKETKELFEPDNYTVIMDGKSNKDGHEVRQLKPFGDNRTFKEPQTPRVVKTVDEEGFQTIRKIHRSTSSVGKK